MLTGANGGIGYALLDYLLSENYHVVALDKEVSQLQSLDQSKVKVLQTDFSYSDAISFDECNEPFDVLIHAAGTREITPFAKLSTTEWNNVLAINLTAAFIISQVAVRLAIVHKKPLCIIYISSISGLAGEPERSAYCASKHGLIGLAKSQAIELAPQSIRVNVIAPGVIETNLTRPYQANSEVMEQLNRNIPLKRWGQPRHIVQTVDLIIKNDYLTGSTLVVDGGWTAGKAMV